MRHTLATYAKQLTEAKDAVKEEAGLAGAQGYDTCLGVVQADQWFKDTVRAMLDGTELPRKPLGL